jgi:RimJ/RimL family protein N-acetyltransferase
MESEYIFTSLRLGFREWRSTDLTQMAAINANPSVMEFFPSTQSIDQTADFINRNQQLFSEQRFCYFAVELLSSREFIGFIGLSQVKFEAPFTPCVDIGWRLGSSHWGKGYATEGALRCLEYAQTVLKLKEVFSMAPVTNIRSIEVMIKIGMKKNSNFIHPLLNDHVTLKNCSLYSIHLV